MDFGTGYATSSAGQKERSRDAQVMQEEITEHVDHDAVKQAAADTGVHDSTAAQHTQEHHSGSADGEGTAGTKRRSLGAS
jgi:hypothetical protein